MATTAARVFSVDLRTSSVKVFSPMITQDGRLIARRLKPQNELMKLSENGPGRMASSHQ
jgi:hypothetical protein